MTPSLPSHPLNPDVLQSISKLGEPSSIGGGIPFPPLAPPLAQ
jgi:hypothetical protein